MTKQEQPVLQIQRIYVKDLSLESPQAPKIFLDNFTPEVHVDLDVKQQSLEQENMYEITLVVTVHATMKDSNVFLIEVHQAGIFEISGFPEEAFEHILGSYCPATLFPFAREAVSDLVNKAGFPQLNLSPINFDAIYMQKKEADKLTGEQKH